MQKKVPLADGLENIAGHGGIPKSLGDRGVVDRELQIMPLYIAIDLPQAAQPEGGRQDVDIIGADLKILDQQLTDSIRHVVVDLDLHHRPELPPADALLHALEQVIRFDLLDLHVRVADDAERVGGNHLQAGEKAGEVGSDELLEPDKIMMMRDRPVLAGTA